MKLQLVISDANPSELSRILAALGSTVSHAVTVESYGAVAATDDDESGDADAAPGTVDKNGLPWDDRIHSTPAKLTGKGVWRAKRGVSDTLVAQVEGELRSRTPAAPQHVQTSPTPQVAQPPMSDPAQYQQPYQSQPMPAQPAPVQQYQQPAPVQQYQPQPMPAQPAPVQQYQPQPMPAQPAPVQQMQPAPGPMDFGTFMQNIQRLINMRREDGSPLIDAAYLNTVAQRVGAQFNVQCNAITDLGSNPEMVNHAVQMMHSEGRWA